MKYFFLAAIIGLAAACAAGYGFFLLQYGTEKLPPSMIEHAAITPLGSGMSSSREIQ